MVCILLPLLSVAIFFYSGGVRYLYMYIYISRERDSEIGRGGSHSPSPTRRLRYIVLLFFVHVVTKSCLPSRLHLAFHSIFVLRTLHPTTLINIYVYLYRAISISTQIRILTLTPDTLIPRALVDGRCCVQPRHLWQDIMYLWQHPAIRVAYAQRHRYWLLDAAAYYFDNVARCAERCWSN